MSPRARAMLGFVGFIAIAGFAMSDRYESFKNAIPESFYYYGTAILVIGMCVVGFHSWWQRYSGRQLDPTISRVKKWFESPTWWNWPF